ncbi:MAG: hypothetical protein K2Q21_12325 [Chitinophagaceae bacterium]|nr:hypothetical protein [Chitinophagaceae bacterium]
MSFNYREIYKILGRSFLGAFNWKVWKWLIGSISTLFAVLKFGKDFFELNPEKSVVIGFIALVILFLFRFGLIFIKESLKYFHEIYTNSVYGEAIIILKDSFAQAHAYRKTPGHQDTEFMSAMLLFCNNLKTIYDEVTKSNCGVSIKVPIGDNKVDEKTVLVNLTRDINHQDRDTKLYSGVKHTIIGNTAFSSSFNKFMLGQKEKHFINNNINASTNYDNTSRQCYDSGKLPYESELVHPIVPIKNVDSKNLNCHGFICIDSNKKNVFNGKYDIAIIEGVADGLYDIISLRNNSN